MVFVSHFVFHKHDAEDGVTRTAGRKTMGAGEVPDQWPSKFAGAV